MKEGVSVGENRFDGFCYHGDSYATFLSFFGSHNPYFHELSQHKKIAAEVRELEKKARAEDICIQLECTLEEFYNGALKIVQYMRRVNNEGAEAEEEFSNV